MTPVVAIVGRPNVGKSSLFNRIAGRRIAIVDEVAGITRDRLYENIHWNGKNIRLIDTGGIVAKSDDDFDTLIKWQSEIAVSEADRIIFVCDIATGLTHLDRDVYNILKKSGKDVILCANKADNDDRALMAGDFYEFGVDEVFPISALHGIGVAELLDRVVEDLEEIEGEEDTRLKIAVVGKPNVGKSSIINKLLGEERSIVSNVPGTTRDSVDTILKFEDKEYLLIDTAGIKASKKLEASVEFYSVVRSRSAIKRADVAVLVIDASCGITHQDLKIAQMIHEEGKSAIIVFNKWDLIKGEMMKAFEYKVEDDMHFLSYAPIVCVSAHQGRNIQKLPALADHVWDQGQISVETSELNKFLEEVVSLHQPPLVSGKRVKILYLTQVGVSPPSFLLFLNNKKLLKDSYERYIINSIRKKYKFEGNPILLKYKNRRD